MNEETFINKESDFPINLYTIIDNENSDDDFTVLNYSPSEVDILSDTEYQRVGVYQLVRSHVVKLSTTTRIVEMKEKKVVKQTKKE